MATRSIYQLEQSAGDPLLKRLLYIEPLRWRMRVHFGGSWIADSENVHPLFEPGQRRTTRHPDLGLTSWYTVQVGKQSAARGAWQHIELTAYTSELQGRVAFA